MNKTKIKIMENIRQGKTKMKPKWWFKLRDYLLKSGWILLTLSGAIVLTAVIYTLELMGLNELWEFGEMGRKIIIDEFPYLMLLGVLILVGLSTMSLPLIGENYKKKRIHIILETTGIVMVVAAILTLVWRIFTRDI